MAKVCLLGSLNQQLLAIFDPIAAPLMTTGASGPAEPPLPIVSQDDINREKLDLNRSSPPWRETLRITSGTP